MGPVPCKPTGHRTVATNLPFRCLVTIALAGKQEFPLQEMQHAVKSYIEGYRQVFAKFPFNWPSFSQICSQSKESLEPALYTCRLGYLVTALALHSCVWTPGTEACVRKFILDPLTSHLPAYLLYLEVRLNTNTAGERHFPAKPTPTPNPTNTTFP